MQKLEPRLLIDSRANRAAPIIQWGLKHKLFFDINAIVQHFGIPRHEASLLIYYIRGCSSLITECRIVKGVCASGYRNRLVQLRLLGVDESLQQRLSVERRDVKVGKELMRYRQYLSGHK